jgi:hypothetical protein
MAVTILETRYQFRCQDTNDNILDLTFTITKDQAMEPGVSEVQIIRALFNRLQNLLPNQTFTMQRIRTTATDEIEVS